MLRACWHRSHHLLLCDKIRCLHCQYECRITPLPLLASHGPSSYRYPHYVYPPSLLLFRTQKKTTIHSSIFRVAGFNMSLSRCVRLDGNTPAASCWLKAPPSPLGRLSELGRIKNHRRNSCVRFVVPHLYARPKITLGVMMRLHSCAELSSPYSSVRSTATSGRPHSSDRGSERESLNLTKRLK